MTTKGPVLSLILALAGAITTNTASAYGPYYWPDGTNSTWTAGSGTQWYSACGSGSLNTWPSPWDTGQSTANATWCDAYFCSSGTYTVTTSGSVEGSGLFFTAGTVTLGGSTGFYFCGEGGAVNVASGLTAYLSTPVGGTCGIFKDGAGTLVITADNKNGNGGGKGALTGANSAGNSGASVILNVGTLSIGNTNALGTGGLAVGGTNTTLQAYNQAYAVPNGIWIEQGSLGAFTIGGTYALSFPGGWALWGPPLVSISNPNDVIVSGPISDHSACGLALSTCSGRLVITYGSNSYLGWTDMQTGSKLAIGASPNALGPTGNNRATLAMHASSATGCYVGTYGGAQTVSSGQPSIYMDANGSFNNTNTLTFSAAYAFDCGTGPSSTLGLYNTADVIISGLVISANGMGGTVSSGSGTSSGIILVGTGRIGFSNGGNTYGGDTYVNGPTLKVNNTSGNAAGSGTVKISGDSASGGVLTGTGIVGPVIVNTNGAIAPGNYPFLLPGKLTTGALTLNGNGHYFWELNSTAGAAGQSSGWSTIQCGALTVGSSSSSPFIIDVALLTSTNTLGVTENFNPAAAYSWTLISASSISGFAANAFAINSSALAGSFSVSQSGNNLLLNYTPPALTRIITTLYNTGLDANGNPLATGGIDAHWTLTSSPDATWKGPNAYHSLTIPGASWIGFAQSPSSLVIGPSQNNATSVAPGNYVYHTTFDLTGLDPSSVVITGRIITDDNLTSFKVNGADTGLRCSYNTWTSFMITSGSGVTFQPGINTVDITVQNGGSSANPSGFQVQWSAAGAPSGPPVIVSQPQTPQVNPGDTATFTVAAAGLQPLSYQWFLNDNNGINRIIAGANDTSLTLSNVQPSDGLNYYFVTVTNALGKTNSAVADLIVNGPPGPVVIPHSQTGAIGSNVTFTVRCSGTPPFTYQWYFNDSTPVSGATDSTLTLSNLKTNDAGGYSVDVSFSGGDVQSDDAFLTVQAAPLPIGPARFTAINVLSNHTVQLTATGAIGAFYYIDAMSNALSTHWMSSATWMQLTGVTNSSGTFQYTDPATNLLRRFYRARLGL